MVCPTSRVLNYSAPLLLKHARGAGPKEICFLGCVDNTQMVLMRCEYQTLAPGIELSALDCTICGFELVESITPTAVAMEVPCVCPVVSNSVSSYCHSLNRGCDHLYLDQRSPSYNVLPSTQYGDRSTKIHTSFLLVRSLPRVCERETMIIKTRPSSN
jgi:hypothetical protein